MGRTREHAHADEDERDTEQHRSAFSILPCGLGSSGALAVFCHTEPTAPPRRRAAAKPMTKPMRAVVRAGAANSNFCLCHLFEALTSCNVRFWYLTKDVYHFISLLLQILPPSLNTSLNVIILRFPWCTFDHSSYSKKKLYKCKNNYDILKIYTMIKYVITK
jgi:hypothetical protein